MRKFVFSSLALMLMACASATPQVDALLSAPPSRPRAHQIAKVPFINQTAGYCGPASLAMALGALGHYVTPEDLGAQAYTPGMKGTFQEDLISTARRQGFMAVPLNGMPDLLAEVRANHPVIVFENLAFTWLPQWHYALVFGYDLDAQKIIMHSGSQKAKLWDLRHFERSWMLGDYWGLVVLRPGELAVSGSEMAHIKSAVVLEDLGKLEAAERAYRSIRRRWPTSLAAGVGLANIAYARGENKEALKVLSVVTIQHPHSAIAWYNLAVAQEILNKTEEARRSARKALSLAGDEDEKAEFEKALEDLF